MNEKIYGLGEEDWPFEYLVTALQILSLAPELLDAYLPKSIETMAYDSGSGFLETDSPIVLTLDILLDCISPGRTWNEWIENKGLESKGIEQDLSNLYSMLNNLAGEFKEDSESIIRDKMVSGETDEWVNQLFACRKLAITILKKISLYQKNELPFKSWNEMYEDLR